jgi:hypothetical protein
MKLKHLLPDFIQDARTVIRAYGIDFPNADHGKTGLKAMHAILGVVSKNRAYDDAHPGFAEGHWKRVLPFDGRDYCWLYIDGANDTHVSTMLRAAKKVLLRIPKWKLY